MDPQEAFKYCPRCREVLDREGNRKVICPKCGFVYFFSPIPCNAIVIKNSIGEILLVERASDPFKGMLDLPGGFVELQETFDESVIREVKEETGIELSKDCLTPIMSSCDRYLYKGVNDFTIGIAYIAELPEGSQIHPQDDIKDAKFFRIEDIPWDNLAFESIKKILKLYIEKYT